MSRDVHSSPIGQLPEEILDRIIRLVVAREYPLIINPNLEGILPANPLARDYRLQVLRVCKRFSLYENRVFLVNTFIFELHRPRRGSEPWVPSSALVESRLLPRIRHLELSHCKNLRPLPIWRSHDDYRLGIHHPDGIANWLTVPTPDWTHTFRILQRTTELQTLVLDTTKWTFAFHAHSARALGREIDSSIASNCHEVPAQPLTLELFEKAGINTNCIAITLRYGSWDDFVRELLFGIGPGLQVAQSMDSNYPDHKSAPSVDVVRMAQEYTKSCPIEEFDRLARERAERATSEEQNSLQRQRELLVTPGTLSSFTNQGFGPE